MDYKDSDLERIYEERKTSIEGELAKSLIAERAYGRNGWRRAAENASLADQYRNERNALAERLHQIKSGVCRECGGSGEIGLADGEVPCPVCGGSGDPTKTGPFPTVKVKPTEPGKSD